MKWQEFHEALGPAFKRLKADVSGGQSPAGFETFRAQAMLAKYSLANLMLIYLQRPKATYCAGYQEWRKLGRQVQQGARGITIWAPLYVKGKGKDKDSEAGQDTAPELRYRLVSVFDIADTAPMETGAQLAPSMAGGEA